MLDKMKYVNSRGQVIEFGKKPFFINYSEIRKYAWNYDLHRNYNRIARFNRGLTEKRLPVVIAADNAEACTVAKNQLHDVINYDIAKKAKGKLYVGEHYIEGYFIAAEPSSYLESPYVARIDLTFCAEKSVWVKEIVTEFIRKTDSVADIDSKSPPYAYPYDYLMENTSRTNIENTTTTDAPIAIVINGYAENPSIRIGQNLYELEVTVGQGEYLIIDGLNKEAKLYDLTGNSASVFGYRNKLHDLFAKVPEGNNAVSWSGSFEFTITLYEERSEPKWI